MHVRKLRAPSNIPKTNAVRAVPAQPTAAPEARPALKLLGHVDRATGKPPTPGTPTYRYLVECTQPFGEGAALMPFSSRPEMGGYVSPRDNTLRYRAIFSNEGDVAKGFAVAKTVAGGGYVGIGAEQNYTLMAMAKSDRAWLADINPDVTALHKINGMAFAAADTPEQFVAFFAPGNRARVKAALTATDPKLARLYDERAGEIFSNYRGKSVKGTLQYEFASGGAVSIGNDATTFLNDPKHYTHVRDMFRDGRVALMTGNVYDEPVLEAAAEAATSQGVPVKLVYTSNALSPRYGDLGSSTLKAGLRSMPRSEDSRLLTTWDDPYKFYGVPNGNREQYHRGANGFFSWSYGGMKLDALDDYLSASAPVRWFRRATRALGR